MPCLLFSSGMKGESTRTCGALGILAETASAKAGPASVATVVASFTEERVHVTVAAIRRSANAS